LNSQSVTEGEVIKLRRRVAGLEAELNRTAEERSTLLAQLAQHEYAEEQLRLIVDAVPVLVSYLDREQRYRFNNRAYEEWFGHSREEVYGRHIRDIVGEEAYAAIRGYLETVLSGQPVSYESLLPYKDGGPRYVMATYIPHLDVRGEVRGLIALVNDMTPRRRAEEERERLLVENQLRAAELHSVISSMAEGVIIYGLGGEIILMNPMAGEITGHSPEDQQLSLPDRLRLLGAEKPGGEPFPADETPVARALSGETVQGVAMVMHRQDGRSMWVTSSAAPIRGADGSILGAVATYADTTQLRELQEQAEELVRAVSHDLRTPLTSIQGYAQLLQRMLKGVEAEGRLALSTQHILASARRMNAMIQDLVDSARLESGQVPVHPRPVDLSSLLEALLEDAGKALAPNRIVVRIPEGLGLVEADPLGLERILINLLTNALKYSADDADVTLTAQREGPMVSVAVEDRGEGIPPEELPHLFDRFYRTKEARYAQGLGLGLYITRKLVEAHGGELTVESRPGEGSIFRFTLPALDPDHLDRVSSP
jgi:PAS domain S-box-containing protein